MPTLQGIQTVLLRVSCHISDSVMLTMLTQVFDAGTGLMLHSNKAVIPPAAATRARPHCVGSRTL